MRGKRAANSGLYGEETFLSLLELTGFPVVSWSNHHGETPVAIYQYPVPHPYRPEEVRAGKNDCMLMTGESTIYCQVKTQNSSGTCDEKLAFSFDIARFALNDRPFDVYALILFGTWWPENPGIIEWAKRKCAEFEMLAGGQRKQVRARVLVGPRETSEWLQGLTKIRHGNLFND